MSPQLSPSVPVGEAHLHVLLIGQARWARLIAAGLNEFTDVEADVIAIDRIRDAFALLSIRRFIRADLLVRVGFRPGAHTTRGVAFDAVVETMRKFGKTPVMYYWLGTDVQNLVRETEAGVNQSRFRRMAEAGTHLADSDSLRKELANLGVQSTTAWLPAPNAPQEGEVPAAPECFTVLSYVPDARYAFYDGPTLIETAKRMPDTRFRIVGGVGAWASSVPRNVEFLGWRTDLDRVYRGSSVLVRSLEHDSVGCMVVEALAYGRPVIYSAEFPHTTRVRYGDAEALEVALHDVAANSRGGEPVPPEVVSWARRTANPASCYKSIAEAILRAVPRRGGR